MSIVSATMLHFTSQLCPACSTMPNQYSPFPAEEKTSANHLHHQYDITAQPKALTPFGKESL